MSIQVRNLSHTYSPGSPDERTALKDVSFDIEDNKIVALIGHTGSGKSTLLQHLNGLLKATEGTITVDGVEITKPDTVMRDIRKKVGLVFQYPEYQLFEETVARDVAFGPKNLGLKNDEVEARVKEALSLVGLDYDAIKDRSPFELSGGQKRRVAIAGVVAMKPKVLILDEPTAGLDPGAHNDIINMIQEIHESEKNIIIFAGHSMADVALLSDKVLVMDRGELVMAGKSEEIFSHRDELHSMGLDVPPVTEMMFKINQSGSSVRTDIFSVDDAADEIYRYLKEKEEKL
jgi:energy-coupling factor transport system ATP-binding protein